MIRVVAAASLTALLILVLYLPSTRPPEAFMLQLRVEHARNADFWSALIAERILVRTLRMHERASEFSSSLPPPLTATSPKASDAPTQPGATPVAVAEMTRVNARIFGSDYLKSIMALLVLASYRLATLMEWVPHSWVFALALTLDALLERARKAREFRHHDPEMFALYCCSSSVILCLIALSMILPWSPHPAVWASLPSALALLIARAVTHFHRRP